MFDSKVYGAFEKGGIMKDELRIGSSEGITLSDLTIGQKILSIVMTCIVAAVLIILPNMV
jgi:hypothetical protein